MLARNGRGDAFEQKPKTKTKSKTGKLITYALSIFRINVSADKYFHTSADISRLKDAEQKTQYLYRQQKLLADITQKLNSVIDIENILDDVLRLVGEHIDVSRVYIFEDIQKGVATSNTFEWCKTGILSQKEILQNVPYKIIPSWNKILQTEGFVFSENIKKLPRDLVDLLEPQDIKSILVYALIVDKEFFGFIGFDECERNKHWRNDEIDLLRTISSIISSAFERKVYLKKLKKSELRLKLAIRAAQQGLWDWNHVTGHVYFSDTWYQMRGFESNDIEPEVSSWEKLIHPHDAPLALKELNSHLKGETDFYETTYRMKKKDGSWRWILDRGMVVDRDINKKPLRSTGIHTDITKQKKTEHRLKKSIETKNKLFSIIAHDLRGPLSNFLPAFEIFVDEKQRAGNFNKEFFEGLKFAYQRTINLVENLLNWSFVQTNTIQINPADYIINDIIEDSIALVSENIKHKLIHITVESAKNYSVFADKDSVNLIIRNLLSNAIKFTGKNGNITIRVYEKEEKIAIEVTDTGVGMTPDILNKLFKSKSFYSTYGTEREKGSGLGLMLCKEFIEMQNGEIYAESTPGAGSRFTFTLSRGKTPMETKAETVFHTVIDYNRLKGKCLLVAEDDPFNQLYIQTLLKQWNIEFEIASNGTNVIDWLQQKRFDLILMDTEMPEIDGYETAKVIRNDLKSKIPIISVSATASEKHLKYAIEAGMNDYVTKPYEPEILFSKIVRIIGIDKSPASDDIPVPISSEEHKADK